MTNQFKHSAADRSAYAFTPKQRGRRGGFTLAEMLVSIALLTLLVLMLTQLMNSAAPIAHTANKHIDTDTQARAVLDRMAVDFARMLKRTDIDYFVKQAGARYYPGHSAGHGAGQKGAANSPLNDQVAFFAAVPGYSPSAGSPSPISLVSYRVNDNSTSPNYNKMERMGKGLRWNGVSGLTNNPGNPPPTPIVFLPLLITNVNAWSAATSESQSDRDGSYELVGPQIFRFEYYYLLQNGTLTDTPWDTTVGHTSINGWDDVEAIAVTIAVIDPQSRSLLTNGDPTEQNLLNVQAAMIDFKTQQGKGPVKTGVIEAQWYDVITNPATYSITAPMPALQAIRIYNRYFDLKTL